MVRALIVDDEALARTRMARLLGADPEIEVCGECRNGREAASFLKSRSVDVVFLDIQMPGENGFDLIETIGVRNMPVTVFVTAHNHYAIQAFKVHALDYLTKPVEEERLTSTVERVKERLESRKGLTELAMRSLLENLDPAKRPSPIYAKRLLLPDGGKTVFLDVDRIEWIEAADYYVCIHSGQKEFLLRESMKDLAITLDPSRFVRIHRSVIVNLEQIREVFREGRGEGTAILKNGRRLRMSQAGWQAVLEASRK
ncbi:two component transcriptional regulator, LytTR family [Terriglobus saanensis SP1PR4]|uniref:Two component transcriptional regulator, LytTR family n=2 Tax=Terriglobus saanensis TaxID=870903 RepID=E8V2F9_TERSS|nr:two component transcriptional regulator, LytTR family [Terriglobus saanensis SP1PR4]